MYIIIKIQAHNGRDRTTHKLNKYGFYSATIYAFIYGFLFLLPILPQAAQYGYNECLKKLIQAGAQLDSQNNDGNTALMIVSIKGLERR